MPLRVNLVDGHGSGHVAKVNGEGEIGVVIHTHPPIDEETISYPFRQYMTSTGISSGSNDMIVDGSTTSQDFYISAQQDRDIFIKTISFRLGDSGTVTLAKFGALTALTTGCDLVYANDALGEIVIADGLTTNLSMIRLGITTAAVGTGGDAFLLDVQGGGSEDTYLPVLDLAQVFGFPWGLRLSKGTNDRITFRINDALAGLITFNAIAYGVQL